MDKSSEVEVPVTIPSEKNLKFWEKPYWKKKKRGKNKFLFITYGNGPSFKFKNKYMSKLINSYEIKKEYIVPEL